MAKGRLSSTTVFGVAGTGGPEPLWEKPDWVARRYGLPRYRVFELIKEGQIRSTLIRRKGRKKGLRLIELSSVTQYLEQNVSKPEQNNG